VDYEETLLELDSITGTWTILYPASGGDEPGDFTTSGLFVVGRLERDQPTSQVSAELRRRLAERSAWYGEKRPDLDLGDAPLESYERQVAHFTFEHMDDRRLASIRIGDPSQDNEEANLRGLVGVSLWRHDFIEARWLDLGVRPDWLWIRTSAGGLVVAADFPNAPSH
jgi:hypothetical protein